MCGGVFAKKENQSVCGFSGQGLQRLGLCALWSGKRIRTHRRSCGIFGGEEALNSYTRYTVSSSEVSVVKAVKRIGLEAHGPSWGRWQNEAYCTFQAAQNGCLSCVRECLEQKCMDFYGSSDTMGYTLLDYALYGIVKGFAKTEEVLQYLKTLSPPLFVVNQAQCVPYRAHVPQRITGRLKKYYLFTAAESGCWQCLSLYLERELIEPLSVSDDERSSTVLDFAEDATEKHA